MCWRITATWLARMPRELVDVLDDGVGCGHAVGFSGLFAYRITAVRSSDYEQAGPRGGHRA